MPDIERSASFYDESFEKIGWKKPEIIPRHMYVIAELKRCGIKTVLDIGCGTGTLLSICRDRGLVCHGFDFSPVAINICKKYNKLDNVWVGNALDKKNYEGEYDAYLAIEVLEHIARDFDVIKNLKPNIPFIFSLPNWANVGSSHVRCFSSDVSIRQRYDKIVNIKSIKKFGARRVIISITKS